MERFNFFNPVEIHYGPYLDILPEIINRQSQEVVIVYGQKSMRDLGAIGYIKDTLHWCNFIEVGGVIPNPTISSIDKHNAKLKCWVIGIGGGSVLDYAKVIATNKHGQKFMAIPTTSGTGSEVTPWATVWDFEHKKKYSFDCTFARHAIIDPTLTRSLPEYETAYTGFDALSHALEAHWSISSNPISDIYALEAIDLILSNLYNACMKPEQIESRSAMAQASLYAGLAFSNTKTTAVHAVSYPMTLHYGIPHGVACSLLLPSFCDYNSGYSYLSNTIRSLAQKVGLPTTLQAAGIPEEGIDVIVKEGFHPDRVGNNPRPVTKKDLKSMLEKIYE